MTPRIRPYRATDAEALAALFYRAVHVGTAGAYTAAQRAAWAPHVPEVSAWDARLGAATALVAEVDGTPAGFMTLDPDTGYIDLAFVAPEMAGHGVGRAIYDAVEEAARGAGCSRLTTAASAVARPFFDAMGWDVIAREEVTRNDVALHRFQMRKDLTP
ncbi:MAG: GNAT family N-acetyltransferase [Pseudomonadota bacterium]